MRFAALAVLAACGASSAPPVAPATSRAPAPAPASTATCSDAAAGLDHATRGVRAPESSVLMPMRARCGDDRWPAAAIECFATMGEGELGRCARLLPDDAREHMFAVLGGGEPDRTAIAVARARLLDLQVGVGECDKFVSAVASVLTCERMPVDKRAQLGTETADFWDLPTHGLPEDAQRRMGAACGASLAQLEEQARGVGCML